MKKKIGKRGSKTVVGLVAIFEGSDFSQLLFELRRIYIFAVLAGQSKRLLQKTEKNQDKKTR